MVVRPNFKLEAKGKDVTEHIRKNLISLSLDDKEGADSDELSLSVSGIYERPFFGETLKVALGINDKLYNYGYFNVHCTSIDHSAMVTEVKASNLDLSGNIKERVVRTWENITVEDIAKEIADKHGLGVIADRARDRFIVSYIQDVSDINFLNRLSRKFGCCFCIKDQTLVLEGDNYTGESKSLDSPEITIHKNQCDSLKIDKAVKNVYGSVQLEWIDLNIGDFVTEKVGFDKPTYYMSNVIPRSTEEARHIAMSKLVELNCSSVKGSLSIMNNKDNLYVRAGYILKLEGIGDDSKAYHIDGVTHDLSNSGYSISISFKGMGEKNEN